MLTILPVNLVLRNDNLGRVGIVCARDRVLEDADSPDDLALLEHALLALECLARAEVARVADDLLRLDGLVAAPDADELAALVGHNLVNRLVEHVGAAVDGAETRERLRELAETVESTLR